MSSSSASAREPARGLSRRLEIQTTRRTELVDITAQVSRAVAESGVRGGLCVVYVPHTTAGVIINENDDPDVRRDLEAFYDRIAPRDAGYRHAEGNADSHIKSTLAGASQHIPIEDGRLTLGRWQAIFFCEFDGPRHREVRIKIQADGAA